MKRPARTELASEEPAHSSLEAYDLPEYQRLSSAERLAHFSSGDTVRNWAETERESRQIYKVYMYMTIHVELPYLANNVFHSWYWFTQLVSRSWRTLSVPASQLKTLEVQ